MPILAGVLDVAVLHAGFYLWSNVARGDTEFARELFALYNVTVLPGSYLARDGNSTDPTGSPIDPQAKGQNPGAGRIRMALVAETAECLEAAQRIVQFVKSRS